ncbi:sulfatase-like hydrolase/transferase [Streptococcus sp. 210928-DFI.4.42]|jgi:arylsulfatase|uniref:LTA synthase family protein n=1 Tax=Streptococcus sp. 210928-DFI.4.42 TaxID=2883234 RepID=UPI001D05CC79|nr:alkaline phosphatase family protein [Streptococcus sp. 210928-DFI.4.42]MCB7060390.1 sulfatase-like hydrolase/transferase [Streptococcus sp. 210928-DFI.4.42]
MPLYEKVKELLALRKITIIKYTFSIVITLCSFFTTNNLLFFIFSILELVIIFSLSNALVKKSNLWGNILNFILILLYNIELLVLNFADSFVTLIMINNLSSWEALKGRIVIYLTGIILLIIFSSLPIVYIDFNYSNFSRAKKVVIRFQNLKLLSLVTFIEIILLLCLGTGFSPAMSIYDLSNNISKYNQLLQINSSKNIKSEQFHRSEIPNHRDKPKNLPERPNVILIFTEGMSQHIIDDDRNVVPNLRNIQSVSLRFDNYYNHTFATYAGIIGQLYSGYQLKNSDKNYLISLPQILEGFGYQTAFINTEPKNREFTTYLGNLGFEKVISAPINKSLGVSSDKNAYRKLFDEMNSQGEKPFLLTMYTFGTHIGMDGFEKKFGDGKDRLLNRFHDMDFQFGKFIDEFNKSKFSENTIVIFTTDHATFVDDEYRSSFPKNTRVQGNLDRIPLFIYYKGINPEVINVDGKNSVNLTPTILDYLDYSAGNYFLGQSLFSKSENNSIYSTLFVSELTYRTTKGNKISEIPKDEKEETEQKVSEYYSIARNK